MTLYSTFVYGGGPLGSVYGLVSTISMVAPERGPSTGGNAFIIEGSGFETAQWSSLFDGVVLDPLKFVDISAGGGTATTGVPNLALSSGAVAGGTAAIESQAGWTNAQVELYLYISPIRAYPASEVDLCTLTMYVDATNYATIGIYLGATSDSLVLRATSVRGGVALDTYETEWTIGTTYLKILRWGKALYFVANGEVVHIEEKFVDTVATFRVACSNNAATYTATSRVKGFYWRPYAVFDDRPVHGTTVVSAGRMRGVVPPSWDLKETEAAYAGLVDVSVVGLGTTTASSAYEYYYVDQFTVINSAQSDVKVSFLSDPQLKTPSTSIRGLGENI